MVRVPLRALAAALPVAAAVGALQAGTRGVAGAIAGIGLLVLLFGGGGLTSAVAGRGSAGRLLAVMLGGLLARLGLAALVLWLLATTDVADGISVATAAVIGLVAALAGLVWASERRRQRRTDRVERMEGADR